NTYTFKNFYNGGGVGLGDFNNDGFLDSFFSGNLVSNKLYLNSGNQVIGQAGQSTVHAGIHFTDITEKAGLSIHGVWTTGVSLVDINADGLLDIYLCKSGPPGEFRRHNELFVNNGDLTFTEKSKEYGLDFEGLSVHAAFFDFDKDGDLDCYLLNNSMRSVGGYDLRKDQRKIPDPLGGNKLLRNDDGKFNDVSQQAGIYRSAIGFGLGVTIGDINKDGWSDIYVSNDFFEKDYLYINNQDGTFAEKLESFMGEISLGSMGADMADINNDALPEIFVTEMLPETDERLKTTSQFESWDKYQASIDMGYYHQFSRNVLQLNNGDGSFSEIARFAGVHATDWSWGALIFDMDNDGLKDIFVANGIYKDLLDQDYVNFAANPEIVKRIMHREKNIIVGLIDSIPTNKVSNYAFQNKGNLTFVNMSGDWGLSLPSYSNGSAYGDLDNDGDLDLVLNNVNMPAFVYENQTNEFKPTNTSLIFSLLGENGNSFAIGTKVTLKTNDQQFYQELSPMRGFMSTVDYKLHFGLGEISSVDSVIVEWPQGKVTILTNVKTNQLISLNEKDAIPAVIKEGIKSYRHTVFTRVKKLAGVDFKHSENSFSDFDRDRLLFNMVSNEGPCLCTGDSNSDGLTDFYVGGAKDQAGSLFLQMKSGSFVKSSQDIFDIDISSEDTDCVFFDANGDGKLDLYVTSGGNEYSSSSGALLDRLYLNKGNNKYEKSIQPLPVSTKFENTSSVAAQDYDKDGDIDLFVGVRLVPFLYGVPGNGYLLSNDGKGNFQDVTKEVAPQLLESGLITDAKWLDVNNDSNPDLIVTGEWMSIKLFMNENNRLVDRTFEYGLEKTNGWYNSIEIGDFNNDGLPDFVAGNHGLNSRFKASLTEPVSLYVNDFDQNGSIEQILTRFDRGASYPLVLRQDIVSQIPSLKKKYLHYKQYANKSISDIFTPAQLDQAIVLNVFTFESAVWINQGKGTFKKVNLPTQAQFSPVYSILIDDFNGDKNEDILLGGNQHRAKPETGIYDASYGLLLIGDGLGSFKAMSSKESGILIRGEVRSLKKIIYHGENIVLIGKNNEEIEVVKY
ncbi:MAG: VCBS repeat-containing protein, partial [Bacteroidia bacterium]|nr:VCBS repeat-containing protein [Bacteroidia bacterium]